MTRTLIIVALTIAGVLVAAQIAGNMGLISVNPGDRFR